ncbi:MAG TPA: ribonuclease E inhibitor RraB [Pyrinomonadaceae bacterium]|nr:ribonuclease E inhibitor RraB [Pyrinomonadaceae bacterium]
MQQEDDDGIMFKDTESQLETIREIFAQAKQEDNWNLDEPMLYSFYFVDESIENLEKLGLHLEEEGFDFVDIFELGDEETGESTGEYLLHIDKTEVHTPESLAERNVRFQKLADEYEIGTYDGWEFGEVGGEDDDDEEDED